MVLLQDSTIKRIAEKTKSSVGQVLLSWAVQRGTVAIPKSAKEERIKQNITVSRSGRLLRSTYSYKTENNKRSFENKEISYPPLAPTLRGPSIKLAFVNWSRSRADP